MNFIEADAKALLRQHGLALPAGQLLGPDETVVEAEWPQGAAVKAQVLSGGRGKAGLIKLAAAGEVVQATAAIRDALGQRGLPPHVLLEERVDVAQEFYLALRIDDVSQRIVLLFSAQGGMEVEQAGVLAQHEVPPGEGLRPDQLAAFLQGAGLSGKVLGQVARFAAALYRVFVAEDAQLLEVNPLALTRSGALLALDAKAVLDDDAHFRHPGWADTVSWQLRLSGLSAIEREAREHAITFVPLDGDIALLTGGAGNGMMVYDALADAGYRPANFVDTMGGSGAARWQQLAEFVFHYAEQPQVRAIVAYFTLSVTPLRYLVDGLLGVLAKGPPPKPLVIGVMASGASESLLDLAGAQRILREAGIDAVVELPDLVARLQQTVPAR